MILTTAGLGPRVGDENFITGIFSRVLCGSRERERVDSLEVERRRREELEFLPSVSRQQRASQMWTSARCRRPGTRGGGEEGRQGRAAKEGGEGGGGEGNGSEGIGIGGKGGDGKGGGEGGEGEGDGDEGGGGRG